MSVDAHNGGLEVENGALEVENGALEDLLISGLRFPSH
jgi:hypothetical protein